MSAVLRRALLIIVVVLISPGVSFANAAAVGADPASFINNLDKQLRFVSSCSSPEQRLAQFHELFRVDFDVSGLSRFVLACGREVGWQKRYPAGTSTSTNVRLTEAEIHAVSMACRTAVGSYR